MGLEVAGEIVELGSLVNTLSDWKLGDKVCALLGGGGYAEYVAVKYDMLMPVPKNCSMVEAAAIPEAFATAYLNLFIEGGIKPGNMASDGIKGFLKPLFLCPKKCINKDRIFCAFCQWLIHHKVYII
jgi:NADPH:quinone reductase-like Zn-dependent oxidoreductase